MGWSNTHTIWFVLLLDPFVCLRPCSFWRSGLPFILLLPCFAMLYLEFSFVCLFYWPGSLAFVVRPFCWGLILVPSSLACALVFFFFSYFWAYFHSSLSPAIELGSVWPATGVVPISPFSLPLLNTFLLLTSSATLTCAHLFLLEWDTYSCFLTFSLTLLLGAQFLWLQYEEFFSCSFTIADSVFGSAFFFLTGLHGLHVFLGLLLLLANFLRFLAFHFTSSRHLGFVFSIWYWHFVDVV